MQNFAKLTVQRVQRNVQHDVALHPEEGGRLQRRNSGDYSVIPLWRCTPDHDVMLLLHAFFRPLFPWQTLGSHQRAVTSTGRGRSGYRQTSLRFSACPQLQHRSLFGAMRRLLAASCASPSACAQGNACTRTWVSSGEMGALVAPLPLRDSWLAF